MSDDIQTLDLSSAPLPTEKTLNARTSVLTQLWRFAMVNLKMMRIIAKGH